MNVLNLFHLEWLILNFCVMNFFTLEQNWMHVVASVLNGCYVRMQQLKVSVMPWCWLSLHNYSNCCIGCYVRVQAVQGE